MVVITVYSKYLINNLVKSEKLKKSAQLKKR